MRLLGLALTYSGSVLQCMRLLLCCQMLENFDSKTRDSKGAPVPAWESYRTEYAEELRLNEDFNRFVANFQLAYQGPNMARDQIAGAKYDTRKSSHWM